MDDGLREKIRVLAETHGLDPEALETALASSDMPDEMMRAIQEVLGDVGMFGSALDGLDKQ